MSEYNYPRGYSPQTYGEQKLASKMSKEAIQRAIDKKAALKKSDPKKYDRKYRGT